MEGSCLSSPRWVSLLVAEIFYPESYFPTSATPFRRSSPSSPPPVQDFQNYQEYLKERVGTVTPSKPAFCDGYDELGCFQVSQIMSDLYHIKHTIFMFAEGNRGF